MYVKRMFYDDWSEGSVEEKEILHPKWDDIESIIKKMDGKKITQITLDDGNEDDYLCIGGGNGCWYNVYISLNDNEEIYIMISPENSSEKLIKLVTGGQEGDFKEKMCVTIEMAIEAARTFYNEGKMNIEYTWSNNQNV